MNGNDPFVDRLNRENAIRVLCWDDLLDTVGNTDRSYGNEFKAILSPLSSFEPPFGIRQASAISA
jgi:hypothetical protein